MITAVSTNIFTSRRADPETTFPKCFGLQMDTSTPHIQGLRRSTDSVIARYACHFTEEVLQQSSAEC